jgi:hypothetical protein
MLTEAKAKAETETVVLDNRRTIRYIPHARPFSSPLCIPDGGVGVGKFGVFFCQVHLFVQEDEGFTLFLMLSML